MICIGKYAYCCKLGSLRKKDEYELMQKMKRRNRRVSAHAVTEENRKAWLNSKFIVREGLKSVKPYRRYVILISSNNRRLPWNDI